MTIVALAGACVLAWLMAFGAVIVSIIIDDPPAHVIATVNSPNGKVQSLLYEDPPWGPGSYTYTVTVKSLAGREKPREVAYFTEVLRDERTGGVRMVWRDDHTLELRYIKAEREDVRADPVSIAGQTVTVRPMPEQPNPRSRVYTVPAKP